MTTSAVFKEIKDKQAKLRMAQLPFEIEIREPHPNDVLAVRAFARKTGDLGVLSANDIGLAALTRQLQRETGDSSRIRTEPGQFDVTDAKARFSWGPSTISGAASGSKEGKAPAAEDENEKENEENKENEKPSIMIQNVTAPSSANISPTSTPPNTTTHAESVDKAVNLPADGDKATATPPNTTTHAESVETSVSLPRGLSYVSALEGTNVNNGKNTPRSVTFSDLHSTAHATVAPSEDVQSIATFSLDCDRKSCKSEAQSIAPSLAAASSIVTMKTDAATCATTLEPIAALCSSGSEPGEEDGVEEPGALNAEELEALTRQLDLNEEEEEEDSDCDSWSEDGSEAGEWVTPDNITRMGGGELFWFQILNLFKFCSNAVVAITEQSNQIFVLEHDRGFLPHCKFCLRPRWLRRGPVRFRSSRLWRAQCHELHQLKAPCRWAWMIDELSPDSLWQFHIEVFQNLSGPR